MRFTPKPEPFSPEDLLWALSRIVQHRREQLRMSQEQLAQRAGMQRTYISDIERGARNVSLMNLQRLAAALDMSVAGLIEAAEAKAKEENDGAYY